MTIYLDSCVYQDLKCPENSLLLNLIIADKAKNIYCFSEALLYDLTRDSGNQKFDDMHFIERIVDKNCWFYDKNIRFEFITPRDYYESFEWPEVVNFKKEFTFFGFENILKLIPIRLSEIIPKDKFPTDCPYDFIELLNKPTNYYEFAHAMLDFTESLTNEQKIFKNFIQYLHKNSLTENIYESTGIKGFDGTAITNKDEFNQSYAKYFIKEGEKKYRYNLYMDMYNGLEIFGIVKGKPRKQKMMNLINDSRHSFFGGFCDIVVSKDEDFIKKSKFLYDANNLDTIVLNLTEFHQYLIKYSSDNSSLSELIQAIEKADYNDPTIEWEEPDGSYFSLKRLDTTFYSYFNAVTFAFEVNNRYFYCTKHSNTFSSGVLTKQIEYVTNKLVSELGTDLYEKGQFELSEIKDEKWDGRHWIIGEFLMTLKYTNKMFLCFSPLIKEC